MDDLTDLKMIEMVSIHSLNRKDEDWPDRDRQVKNRDKSEVNKRQKLWMKQMEPRLKYL